jgi:hypothetical protein
MNHLYRSGPDERLRQAVLDYLSYAPAPVDAHAIAAALGGYDPSLARRVAAVLDAECRRGGSVLPVPDGPGGMRYWLRPRRKGRGRGTGRVRLTPSGMPLPPVPPGTRDQGSAPRSPYRGVRTPRPAGSQGY